MPGAGFVGRFALPDGEQSIEVKIGRRGDDGVFGADNNGGICLLYTSPSPRD